ncbi:MAG: mobile mystery protein A [Ignavibacteriae bacterium]|nr:mobile mystery protein A [Ignavibacteriota bacterium]
MKNQNRKILIGQLDRKFEKITALSEFEIPTKGWIYSIRTALNMSLTQLAKKLRKTTQSVKEIEEREANKNITIKKLMEVAEALNLQFVYGFIPREKSIEVIIEKRAYQIAREIVLRTSQSMSLEAQENRKERLEKAIQQRAEEIKEEMPKYLWD